MKNTAGSLADQPAPQWMIPWIHSDDFQEYLPPSNGATADGTQAQNIRRKCLELNPPSIARFAARRLGEGLGLRLNGDLCGLGILLGFPCRMKDQPVSVEKIGNGIVPRQLRLYAAAAIQPESHSALRVVH